MIADRTAYRLAADPVLWDFWDGEPPLPDARTPAPDINYRRYHRPGDEHDRPHALHHRLAEGLYV